MTFETENTAFDIASIKAIHKCKTQNPEKSFGNTLCFYGFTLTLEHETEEARNEEFQAIKEKWLELSKACNQEAKEFNSLHKMALEFQAKLPGER